MAAGDESGGVASDWQRHVDDASGATYYYNACTGESSWERPEGFVESAEGEGAEREQEPREPPRWRKFTDDESGKAYYYDEANDVTQWEEPEGFVEEDDEEDEDRERAESEGGEGEQAEDDKDDESANAGSEGTKEEDSNSKNEGATESSADAAPAEAAPAKAGSWTKYVDASSGKPYYHNVVTGVTQWEQPAGFRESAGVAPAVSAEYQTHLVRVQAERLSRVTQQALDPTGSLSKLNAILSGIGGSAAEPDSTGGEGSEVSSRGKPEWQQHVDPQSQRYYYYNTATGITQWTKPDAPIASGLADWIPPEDPEDVTDRKTVSGSHYVSQAKFNRLTGKYEQLDNDEYWNSVGAPSDRAGRQMSHFFDVSELEKNREEARRKAEALKRKNINWKKVAAEKKAKKQKQKNEWLFND